MSAATSVRRHSPYPSRVEGPPSILPRVDPVVWGGPSDGGPLDADHLGRYEADGFIVVDDLLTSTEVATLERAVGDLIASMDPSDERLITEPGSSEVRSVFAVHRLSADFADLLSSPRLVDPVRQILGSDVYIHQSRINRKPGFHGKEFAWHSDFETWHAEDGMPRMRALSVSIALTENRPDNGSLMIVSGSHRHFVSCVGPTPANNHVGSLRNQVIGVPDAGSIARLVERGGIATCVGPPGSATMFDSNCVHGSNSNITPYGRTNIFAVYNSVENALEDPYAATSPRPSYLAEREVRPIGAPATAATAPSRFNPSVTAG